MNIQRTNGSEIAQVFSGHNALKTIVTNCHLADNTVAKILLD